MPTRLLELGKIKGGCPADKKFGIYFGRTKNDPTEKYRLLLCLILAALPRRQQYAKNYCKFYDHYNINLIGEIFNAKPKELSGGECAWWSIEFNSQGWTREQIDAKIEDVLKGHNKEIGRIKKIGT